MASSKLKIKQTNRNRLFYSKFLYKVTLPYLGVRFIYHAKDIKDFKIKFKAAAKSPWSYIKYELKDCNLDLLERIIEFKNTYKGTNKIGLYRSSNHLAVYTSDLKIVEELHRFDSGLKIEKAFAPPPKTMYFAKKPEFSYRVYLKSVKLHIDEIKSFIQFYETNKERLFLSASFARFLDWEGNSFLGTIKLDYRFLSFGFFIDYNDESTLTLLSLVFPEILGKTYKLEKRP